MLVPRSDQEERRRGAHPLVVGHRNIESLQASRDAAFAEDLQPLVADLECRADALDVLVHLAEERLVPPDPLRAILHRDDRTAGARLGLRVRGMSAGMGAAGLRLLREARALIAEAWCRGAEARDDAGSKVCPWDDRAASWSLLGAIVAVLEREASRDRELSTPELATALYALATLVDSDSLVEWNDRP